MSFLCKFFTGFLALVFSVGCSSNKTGSMQNVPLSNTRIDEIKEQVSKPDSNLIIDDNQKKTIECMISRISDKKLSLQEKFLKISETMIGTPYFNGPLGEGFSGQIDKDPLFDFEKVDCVTFLEQCIALAMANNTEAFLPNLIKIRYRDGIINFLSRNHYMVLDWIPNNNWLVSDITSKLGAGYLDSTFRTIDKKDFFLKHGVKEAEIPSDVNPGKKGTAFIPVKYTKEIIPGIKPGDLVFFLKNRPEVFITHTGMIVKDVSGQIFLRHASSAAGKVIDENFLEYLKKNPSIVGFKICRLND